MKTHFFILRIIQLGRLSYYTCEAGRAQTAGQVGRVLEAGAAVLADAGEGAEVEGGERGAGGLGGGDGGGRLAQVAAEAGGTGAGGEDGAGASVLAGRGEAGLEGRYSELADVAAAN